MSNSFSRRRFLGTGGALSGSILLGGCSAPDDVVNAPAVVVSEAERPKIVSGIQLGDVNDGQAMVWSRSDRNALMVVEYDTTDRFANARRVVGPLATA